MNLNEPLRDVENLRFRIQMNNRLRLECLAAVSKVFREFSEPINDELLSSIVFALPQELLSGNGYGKAQGQVTAGMSAAYTEQKLAKGNPPEEPEKPGLPPQEPEPEKPSLPPQSPEQAPALPPQSPEEAPALPPMAPVQSAIA
jgi:hypothetical protein